MEGNYFVYVIICKERKRYIGATNNWRRRLKEHNNQLPHDPQWTERFSNWRIVYLKKFDQYAEARKWELNLKRQKGGVGLDYLIENTNEYSGVEQSGSSGGS